MSVPFHDAFFDQVLEIFQSEKMCSFFQSEKMCSFTKLFIDISLISYTPHMRGFPGL